MNAVIQKQVEQKYLKADKFSFRVGDTVKVHNIIRDGDKTRVQIFKGVVISRKGSGVRENFTVRKISDGIGVEKIFPLHSPNVDKIDVVKTGKTKRSKLYYLRDRVGKSALKVKQGESLDARAEKAASLSEKFNEVMKSEISTLGKQEEKVEESVEKSSPEKEDVSADVATEDSTNDKDVAEDNKAEEKKEPTEEK